MSDATDHRRYLDALAVTPDLDVERDRALAGAEESSRSGVDAALRAERVSASELRLLVDQVDRLSGPVESLARRAGVDASMEAEQPPPKTVEDARRMVEAVTADLRSAERSWDWVGREQARAVARPVPAPRPTAPPPPAAGLEGAPSSIRRWPGVVLVAGLLAAVVVLLLAVLA